jgi:DNA-binding HxlR family transcriptional regulator
MQFTPLCSLHIESYVMPHTNLTIKPCPIALSLDRVGEGWSIMILRDAFLGLTRFDQFQRSLGIAPNILSRRLRSLVESGLLEKSRYSEHPPRDAYLLTERGRDFRPVLWALLAWGNKHFMPEGEAVVPIENATGWTASSVTTDQSHPSRQAVLRSSLRNTEIKGQS